MIINNVQIENFRCYYGINKIKFNQNGKITLIYGDSGYGKSSLLQFFKWMFYNDCDFGPSNDKPLYNIAAYSEIRPGNKFKVSGVIEFEHLGVKYSLSRANIYEAKLSNLAYPISQELTLQHLVNDNWQRYNGDVTNKINSILPKGLSKYFLLDGEKARELVLNATELRSAIHQLFGIDAYANALSHLGNPNKRNSVIGQYQLEMTSKMTGTSNNGMTAAEIQDVINEKDDQIRAIKSIRNDKLEKLNVIENRIAEIFKILGESNSKDNISALIKANDDIIKTQEEKIVSLRKDIGDLFYKCYPYLFLSRITNKSAAILREKNKEFVAKQQIIFENVKKELLKEILDKNVCVCGRHLDDDSTSYIMDAIAQMPPDSYSYQFGQFISKSKNQIRECSLLVNDYDTILTDISVCNNKITECQNKNKELMNELKRLEESKDIVEELEQCKIDKSTLTKEINSAAGEIAKLKQLSQLFTTQLNAIERNNDVSETYKAKIEFYSRIALALDQERRQKEAQVKSVLNDCVKSIFRKLTTQTDLDVDKIQFVNSDFTLRSTYLTGGQLAIDEYSYVIGILKALQECKMENNENPIIIDAPFAFTGNEQSEHIFKTLPTVSKQTILLTLDLNKIKNVLNETDKYDFYVIKNETQDKAVLAEGDINDIKF